MREHIRSPIVIPRWVLILKYALFVLMGLSVWWASAPAVDALTPDWYTPVWALGVTLSATVAVIGSARERWESLERLAAVALASLLIVYAVSPIVLVLEGDADRAAFSVVALVVCLMPAARAVQLIKRTGIRHE